jgi:phospholipid/cholesterol/gamma-HCH transport system substrate-binding protein
MQKYKMETAVGLFALVTLMSVAYLTIKLGKMEILGGDYYHVDARFYSVQGLRKGSFVQIAGVQVGQVDGIELDTERMTAVVDLKIRSEVPLDEDAIASIKTSGLIGDKYIKIEPGGSDVLLKDGDVLIETESAVDLEELVSKYIFGDVQQQGTQE